MGENQEVGVVAINRLLTSNFIIIFFLVGLNGQNNDSVFKKNVLDNPEVSFLTSYYSQEGDHASVTGGIGTEKLTDFTPTVIITMPLNPDEVLTFEVGISAYSSASSSNGNPFDISGSSAGYDDDDDDDDYDDNENYTGGGQKIGTPWIESSGASASDIWSTIVVDHSKYSEDRNQITNKNFSIANEYDYNSIGFGGGITKLYNQKNTSLSFAGKIFIDKWNPVYPTELKAYSDEKGDLTNGYFSGVDILDSKGQKSTNWAPINNFNLIENEWRNSYSISLSGSQIVNEKFQFSLFMDLVYQKGWLANPLQRVYFSDIDNYYIGNSENIINYTSKSNTDVFQLADDIERLPSSRFKSPFGFQSSYYINEKLVFKNYFRRYQDDWGITSNTYNVDLPIKLNESFTIYPAYRKYTQTKSDFFAPYESHLSTSQFYTSDYDLSEFSSEQFSFGVGYTDIFTNRKLFNLGLKSVNLNFSNYIRSDGLDASIFSISFDFEVN